MNTSTEPNNHRWLRKWLRLEPHQPIGAEGEPPYLLRWYVIPRNRWLNVYLHKFLRDDEDRALHDHPWWFVSLMLWGQYVEFTDEGRAVRSAPEPWRWFWGDQPLAFRPGTWRHRVELIKVPPRNPIPCWTLIITGRRRRLWGFWCRRLVDTWSADTYDDLDRIVASTDGQVEVERFIPWDEFGAAGCGEPVRSDR
ncbi:hypothetical protein [Mycobacteroides abscessus]|uniref:Uncharacterized protein n=1 Tax=Mycobacteroides abscessus subsp. massiliense TaxID=1962118 RepID=A0A1U0VR41_9MYCO|nr:hypothetical protein [Mycobacteroides abscessus]SKL83258.1 Uncharacterised protein [Mycobacteroides abscessus subsp. massiliense]SKS92021.1 Uncharacterised protein [Mycobacteroides abscessus subsp. massiliense]SKT19927.1 Uncharacterised protein [Mycobacteroides abscessus subsp. massiliense]SKW82584.1 Uncharacterised protein [Mycobacteroides abscessus subsp. massiliense]SLC05579.1 Uncharacterised protein [Mycobacteroides abscessus subsp. massiliense]